MNLTITLNPATLDALSAEAAARNATCEQVICDMVENYFAVSQSPDQEYDAWFRRMYEEGIAAFERGDFCSHAEVQKDMAERKAKYLARMEKS